MNAGIVELQVDSSILALWKPGAESGPAGEAGGRGGRQTGVVTPTWQAPHAFNDSLCMQDFAFHDYIETAPTLTPPPTSTASTDESSSSMPWLPLALAGMVRPQPR